MERVSACLSIVANIAAIVTAFVAVGFWLKHICRAKSRRKRLENYLNSEGQRACSMADIVAYAGMTEEQVFEAAHSSKRIESMARRDEETGETSGLYFTYRGQ